MVGREGGETDLAGDTEEQFTGETERSWKYVGDLDLTTDLTTAGFSSLLSVLTVLPRAEIRLDTPRAAAISVTAASRVAGTWAWPV